MPIERFGNAAQTTLTAGIATTPAAGTSETWAVTSTALTYPQIVSNEQFRAIITTPTFNDATPEIVIVTAINDGTHFQVSRGAEGSTIKTHANGDLLVAIVTAGALDTMFRQQSGKELGRAILATSVTISNTVANVPLTVPVVVPAGADIYVEAYLPAVQMDGSHSTYVALTLQEDGATVQTAVSTNLLAGIFGSCFFGLSKSPTTGAHTYNLQANTGVSGAVATVTAIGGQYVPYMRVVAC